VRQQGGRNVYNSGILHGYVLCFLLVQTNISRWFGFCTVSLPAGLLFGCRRATMKVRQRERSIRANNARPVQCIFENAFPSVGWQELTESPIDCGSPATIAEDQKAWS
jgi:hypothetical protein